MPQGEGTYGNQVGRPKKDPRRPLPAMLPILNSLCSDINLGRVPVDVSVFLHQGNSSTRKRRYHVPTASYFQSPSKSIYGTASKQS